MKIEISNEDQNVFFDQVREIGVDEASRAIGDRILQIFLGRKITMSHHMGMAFYGLELEELTQDQCPATASEANKVIKDGSGRP